MLGLNEYTVAFKQGLNYVLYDSEKETRKEPKIDNSSLTSIGYYDGYQYGEYCEMVGISMSISQEQLIAVIDKYHTQALERYSTYQEQYIRYKSGFIDGKFSLLEKIHQEDISFNELPEINQNDIISIGYHDGYAYYLDEFVKNGTVNLETTLGKFEEITKSCYEKRIANTETIQENKK